ncbi:right-handed parallel beta-helix repeat-containing protein [Geomonas edaphica]|uniref:right-handed parallel beta-helix repeat-containing protein n=1 Tax=Geomonas edaphica TaxID=2570226 RepID=UPI0010A88724|nr:right-handed parallel beta-helix repeat-containing protein [Geomonas edaphica]
MRTWTKILLVAAMGLSAGCGDSTLSESQPTQTAVQKEAQTTTVYRVDLNARPGGDGKSWAAAFDSLQAAFAQNLSPDSEYEVWIRHGTYHLPAELRVSGSPRIYGGFDGKEVELSQRDWEKHKTVIDGDNLFRGIVKEQSAGRLIVDGVELTRCLDGAIVTTSISGRLNVSNCKLTDNRGGAVSIHEGFFLIKNCEFTGNVSSKDGAAIRGTSTRGSIEGCSFTRNISAGSGGAVNCFYLDRVLDCAFIGNSADLDGGAICMDRGINQGFINCLFTENEAQHGGAVYCAEMYPSGFFTNCTFVHNRARVGGGAVHCNSLAEESGVTLRIANAIIWGNLPNQIGVLRSDSVEVTYSDIMGGFAGAGNIDADPMFKGGKFLLRQHSPCINAGTLNATDLPATDFEGNPRVVDGIPDMGYVEAELNPAASHPTK